MENYYLLVAVLCVWYVTGCLSFAYWWTRQYKLTRFEMPVMVLAGFSGPVAFLLGYVIHKDAV